MSNVFKINAGSGPDAGDAALRAIASRDGEAF
jgi:hypothetical protein